MLTIDKMGNRWWHKDNVPVLHREDGPALEHVNGNKIWFLNGKMTDCAKSRYITSLGGTIISNLLLGTKLSDMTSGFELFKREALQKILDKGILSRGPFFQTEIRAYAHQFRITEVPIHHREASHNIGGADLRDAFSNLWRLFCIRFSKGLITPR